MLSRRNFVKLGVVAGITPRWLCARAGAATVGKAPSGGVSANGDWFDRPMRFANLTLVEEDVGRFDSSFWLDYFASIHADCATLSAGGYMAYYPTKIPLHHAAAGVGEQDPFGTLYRGCRERGMNVIARIDPHACREEVRAAHPDWISTDAKGQPRRHLAKSDLWITCALGPYNFEFMRSVIAEIVSRYPVDAVFSNRWNGIGWCYCPHCRANFRAASGRDIPQTEDPGDPGYQAFVRWQQERLFALWSLWDETVRAGNPRARFIPNMGGGIWQFLDMREIGRRADILFADRQGRTAGATGGVGLTAPWAIGRAGKEFRAVMGRKPVAAGYSVGVEEPYRWKDSVQSEAEQRVWMADGIANGLRLSFGKTGAKLYDNRWMEFTGDLFRWHHRHERYLRNTTSLARVGMLYSQKSATTYGRAQDGANDPTARHYHNFVDYPYRNEDHSSGMYHALIEARVSFDMVCDQLLDPESIDRYRVLVLPNISVLTQAQCEALRGYVQRGGRIVATYETSLYDENGKRTDFGLGDLFGVRFKGWRTGPVLNSYIGFERGQKYAAQILRGLDGAERIVGGVWYLDVEQTAKDISAPLSLIPAYPHLPMEEVYPRERHTDIPELILREVGMSRIAYFPWDVDRLFWEALLQDHGRILANTLSWALDEDPAVTVEGSGVIDVVPWQQESSCTLHLVNFTNPHMMKGPFRELIPVGEQRVSMRLPAGRSARAVHLLVSGRDVPFTQASGRIELTVPFIRDHEVVAIDFA